MAENAKPIPSPTDATAPFWAGCAAGILRLRQCPQCSRYLAPGRMACPCGHMQSTWADTSGRGTVFSYTVVHRAPDPAFRAETPYVIAIVELAEGPRLLSNIVGCRPEDVRVDMPVTAVFEEVAPGLGLHKFKPAGASSSG